LFIFASRWINGLVISFVPLINRLTSEGGVPYFRVPGNHEATTTEAGLRNHLNAVSNPYHFVVVHVEGDKLEMEVIGVDWGTTLQPYRTNKVELQDSLRK
jgi:hypothetical protein